MKRKKVVAMCMLLLLLVTDFNVNIFASQQENGMQDDTAQTEDIRSIYLINETTSIKSDFYRLGIERVRYRDLEDLLRSSLISMICLDSKLYTYWVMPEDTDYQVSYIVINNRKYENDMQLLASDRNYRKYVFEDFEEVSDGQYEITEIGFQNPEGRKTRYTTKINCQMGNMDGEYYFEQEAENHIVLVGMLLESIYQFDNEKGELRDAWNNFWNNIEQKDDDQRSFYYFAFNCFDREINNYFTPDAITKIVIDYTINQYTYLGKQKGYQQAKLTKKEQKIQTVTSETIHVEAKDKYDSNDHPYEYNTIYKLSDAEIKEEDKAANYNTLYTAQQAGFEWVVHFGNTEGYRYAYNTTKADLDIDYTKVEEFSTISISYIYKGLPYHVNTDTVVDMEVVVRKEEDHTESLIKQATDTIGYALEDMGEFAGNVISGAVNITFDLLEAPIAAVWRGVKTAIIRILKLFIVPIAVISVLLFLTRKIWWPILSLFIKKMIFFGVNKKFGVETEALDTAKEMLNIAITQDDKEQEIDE